MDRLSGGGRSSSGRMRLALVAGTAAFLIGAWIWAIGAAGGTGGEPGGDPAEPANAPVDPGPAHHHGGEGDDEDHEEAHKHDSKASGSPGKAVADAPQKAGEYAGVEPRKDPEVRKGRIENAALQFVIKAYGYTGDDVSEYTSNVNKTVVSPEFYQSPGADSVNAVSREVDAGGTESTARLDSFEIEEESDEKATGVAYFSIEDDIGGGNFSQELELVKWGAVYKVIYAGPMQEV